MLLVLSITHLRILLISLVLSLFLEASDVTASSKLPCVRTFPQCRHSTVEILRFLCDVFTVTARVAFLAFLAHAQLLVLLLHPFPGQNVDFNQHRV